MDRLVHHSAGSFSAPENLAISDSTCAMTHTFRLIRRLARELKYLPLELLWNYPLIIHSIATIEQDLRQELGDIVPAKCQLLTTPEMMIRMLEKYQFLDLTIQVPAPLLLQSNYETGISLLRQLFPQNQDNVEANLEEADELENLNFSRTFLEMLVEDLDTDSTFCRMRIESRSRQTFAERFEAQRQNQGMIPKLPDSFFPHLFLIRDACLTNAKGVWFYKYFYL